jgi:hypothetical protein
MPDLLDLLSPNDIIQTAQRGFDRFEPNRQTMKLTVQTMAGQYYGRISGEMCQQPLALSYNAARVLLPNLVMTFPRHIVETPFLPARQYAEDLGTALSIQDRKLKIDNVYRRVICDSLHSLGIMKTGIAAGGTIVELEEEDGTSKVDAGAIYTERVSFNNFVADPDSREYLFSDARFLGDIIRVPRQVLLDSGLYDEDQIMELGPGDHTGKRKTAVNISMKTTEMTENDMLEDIVEICELYIPSANVIVTIPGDFRRMEKFLRVADYYGIKDQSGPYTFLSLTMPVPDNPLPTPFFSVLLDLEMKVNRMENKLSHQAERQKDIVLYHPDAIDEAVLVRDASDGEMVSCNDPNNIKMMSYGGQQQSNEEHLTMLLNQYNSIAANLDTLSGASSNAKSATAAGILQQNAGTVLADMKDAVYRAAEEEGRKRAFYIHYDPFLNETLTRRTKQPGEIQQLPTGPHWITPPSVKEVQVILTPEARSGDFLDMVFRIEPESMGRVDSKVTLQQKMMFCQQILPAVSAAAQIFQTLGIPFDVPVFLMKLAQDMGILWLDEVLFSPEIQQKTALDYQRIQTQTGSDVKPGHANQPNPNLNNQMMQNGQPAAVMGPQQTQAGQMNAGAQAGAMDSQRLIRTALSHALGGAAPKPALPQMNANG